MKIYPVIMSGGSGTRLWPLSRRKLPKQYLGLFAGESLFSRTLKRCAAGAEHCDVAPPTIICAQTHVDMVLQELSAHSAKAEKVILEPVAKNTALVAAVASAYVSEIDPDGFVLMLPADHHIGDDDAFWRAIISGLKVAEQGSIVTLGIVPKSPETGYGYIQRGDVIGDNCYDVKGFTEKPELATAQAYLNSGQYFWNAGIFLYSAETMLKQFDLLEPRIAEAGMVALANAEHKENIVTLSRSALELCPSISLDYAIMEKTHAAGMVVADNIEWDDVGSWAAIGRLSGNTIESEDAIEIDSKDNCLVSAGKTIAVIGLDDLVVVETADSILVMPKSRSQDVSTLVKRLEGYGRKDLT